MALQQREVLEQSRAAQKQWGPKWELHAKTHGEMYAKSGRTYKELLHRGVGRTLLCVAFAPSFEHNIDVIKQYQDNVDIACVDKCFTYLMDHGIRPDYVFVSDAGIDFDRWCKKYVDQTEGITLLSVVTSNPEWAANWKGDVFWYVNKDNIETEKIYGPISGVKEQIPAASNVGNSVVVFSTMVLGYDKYLLLGYDYGWKDSDNYYAFVDNDKRYWMKHAALVDIYSNIVYTSQNLLFSARWLSDYIKAEMEPRGVKIFNCSDSGILECPKRNLKRMLESSGVRSVTHHEKGVIIAQHAETISIPSSPTAPQQLQDALLSHRVTEVHVKYLPERVAEWMQSLN